MTRRRRHDFEMLITRAGDVLRGSNGRRWKALTLIFPTTPWLTYFDLKTSSYGSFELVSFCAAFAFAEPAARDLNSNWLYVTVLRSKYVDQGVVGKLRVRAFQRAPLDPLRTSPARVMGDWKWTSPSLVG